RGALRPARDLGARQRLFIRISPHWLLEPRHVRRARDWARSAHLVPAQIVFELDDLTELRGAAAARQLIAPLPAEGFGLAVTCRGASLVTLDDLMTVSPDIVKLPTAWVHGIGRSRVRRELVAALVRLARTLDVVVVASGADTVDDLAALVQLGVRYAKGRVFGKPWVTFAVPRPFGMRNLAAIWSGEIARLGPSADSSDDETGDVSTALRKAEPLRLVEGASGPAAPLLRPSAQIEIPPALPLSELVAQIDSVFTVP